MAFLRDVSERHASWGLSTRRSVRGLLAAIAVALGLGCAVPASANVFAMEGRDPRAPQPRIGADQLEEPVTYDLAEVLAPR